MKIVFVIHSLGGGGAERVTTLLANFWCGLGHKVTVITLASRDHDCYSLAPGIKRIALETDSLSSSIFEAVWANTQRIHKLRKALRSCGPSVVIAMMTTTAINTLIAGLGLGFPIVVSERTFPPMLPQGPIWETLRKVTYPWAKCVVVLTNESAQWLKKVVPAATGVVVPNPIAYPVKSTSPVLEIPNNITADCHLLLAAGRCDSGKQFDVLIDAFSRSADKFRDWKLAILGEGPERPTLQQYIHDKGLSSRVIMPGRAGNIGEWYERADLFALSSKFEGFPNVLLEAMSYGCPAVSYDCDTGPRNIIRHDIDGLLVDPDGSVEALQVGLSKLMEDDDMRQKMSQRAVEVRERFAPAKVLEMWEAIIGLSQD